MPESFNVLVKEIRLLGIDIDLERELTRKSKEIHERTIEDADLSSRPPRMKQFDAIKIGLASPGEDSLVVLWRGEEARDHQLPHLQAGARWPVLRQDLRPDQGLRVPVRKYKRLKHRGVICESAASRSPDQGASRTHGSYRTRFARPVAHIWFLKSLPSASAWCST